MLHTLPNSNPTKLFTRRIILDQRRWTSSKRVQDRSKDKRIRNLEIAVQKHKVTSKILTLLEILNSQRENVMPVAHLGGYRQQINLPKPHSINIFLQKVPKLIELYKDRRGRIWCGMTEKADELVREGEEIIDRNRDKAAEYVTRMLMMSVDRKLFLDKIAHFRRDLGLPIDFRKGWVHQYPELFRVVQPFWPNDEGEYLELVSWRSDWAITELEKAVLGKGGVRVDDHVPGVLCLAFPLKFPGTFKKVCRIRGKIDCFQKREYLSPYAEAKGLEAGSLEFDKRAVAVMHELLSFTVEKRLVTDYLTHFRREYVMPQRLMRLLLKHFGIFYVSERGKRFSVFLTEAYDGSELIEKHPLVVWKEKVLAHIGFRGKNRRIESYEDFSDSDVEIDDKLGGDSEGERSGPELEQDGTMYFAENASSTDGSEMDIEDVSRAYNE